MGINIKQDKRAKRRARIRARISGTSKRPRLALFRSNKHVYAQLIDDETHRTLLSLSDLKASKAGSDPALARAGSDPAERAKELGKALAKKSKEAKIDKVVFDRRGYAYHGIIKTIAEAARLGGLEF